MRDLNMRSKTRTKADIRNWPLAEQIELLRYFDEHGWKYDPSTPSRVSICGVPKDYSPSGIQLKFGKYIRCIHRWQMVEMLRSRRVNLSPKECTHLHKPEDSEIINHHLTSKTSVTSLRESLYGVTATQTASDVTEVDEGPTEAPEAIQCLYLKSFSCNPTKMEMVFRFEDDETGEFALVSSLNDQSFCVYTHNPIGVIDLETRYKIMVANAKILMDDWCGEEIQIHFSGIVDSDNYLVAITGT